MGRRRHRLWSQRAGIVVAALVATTILRVAPSDAAGAATAGPAPARKAGDVLSLAGQTPWIGPGGDALFRLKIRGEVSGLQVAATVHRAVGTRSQLLDTIAGRRLGPIEGLVSDTVDHLPVDADGNRVLSLGIQDPTQPRNPARIALGRSTSAIYPVDIEIRRPDSDTAVDHFVTHLAVLTGGIEPLTAAIVWRIDATPGHRPDGSVNASARRDFAPGGRLARMVDALDRYSSVPLTVAPTPETLEAWAFTAPHGDPAEVPAVAALRAMTLQASRQFVITPYIPVDLPSLEAAGLGEETAAQFARAEDTIGDALTIRPDPRTVVAGSVDANSFARLRDVGADHAVVDAAALPVTSRLTPARPMRIASRGRVFTAAASDAGLTDLFGKAADPAALRAQRVITGLLLVALEAPSDRRGVVVETPLGWDAPEAMIDAILSALQSTPALRPDTLDGYFSYVPTDGRGPRSLNPTARVASDRLGVDRDSVRAARRRLNAFSHLVGDNNEVASSAERDLLVAEASATTAPDRRRARTYFSGVDATIDGVLARVIAPEGRSVTLTARRASIPISLLNANPWPLQVRVHVASDKLLFPSGDDRLLTLAPRNTTERFAVEARTSGAFPLSITVTSPDRDLQVTSTQLTVRSTAVSGVGVFIAVGAAVFLFLWWGTHLRRRGRHRLRTLAAPITPADVAASSSSDA